MAVYTKISRAQLADFLGRYDPAVIGALQSFEGIVQGVENTNYHVFTDAGRYVLTLFEKRTAPEDLPFFMGLTAYLAGQGITCPQPYPAKDGQVIGALAGRPAVLVPYLEGDFVTEDEITPAHCRAMGALAARLHLAAQGFAQRRDNTMGLAAWQALFDKTEARADEVEAGLAVLIRDELAVQQQAQQAPDWTDLPRGIVHADLFPDNVFFSGESISGVIDFYFACEELYIYDLGLIINAWCFDPSGSVLLPHRLRALREGYESVRPLSAAEKQALPMAGRAAALRILMTRLHDWLCHDPESVVTAKDPRPYSAILRYYRQQQGIGEVLAG